MKIITTILFILSSIITFAQGGAMADLKFEEAEIAFNMQDYETTIKKLDEFDKLLGSIKDKSLYLRIISQDKLFEPSKLYENESQFNLQTSLRKNASAYLKAMESNGLDERYREVYAINEKLANYPKDKTVWIKEKQKSDLKKQEAEKKNKELEDFYRELTPKIEAWEWINEIKIGENCNELKKKFPNTYRKYKFQKDKYNGKEVVGNLLWLNNDYLNGKFCLIPSILTNKNFEIVKYELNIGYLDNIAALDYINKITKQWENEIGKNCYSKSFVKGWEFVINEDGKYISKESCYEVSSPLTTHKIAMYIIPINKTSVKITVEKTLINTMCGLK